MNNIKTWTKYDTYFIIVSCVISFILIGFGLMRYSNLLIKFIFFGIVASLLFFLFRYLKHIDVIFPRDGEVWHPKNTSSDPIVSSEDNTDTNNIEEFTTSDSETDTKKFKLTHSDNNYSFKAITIPSPVLATTAEAAIVSEEEEENNTSVEEEENNTSVEEEEENHYHNMISSVMNHHHHHATIEEEGITVEDEDCERNKDGECKKFFDHKKKMYHNKRLSLNKHIGIPDSPGKNTMSPYQSPVNINVSYISKN